MLWNVDGVPPPQSPSKNSYEYELIAGDDMCCPGQSLFGRPTGDASDAIFSANTCTMTPSEAHPAAAITQPCEHRQSTPRSRRTAMFMLDGIRQAHASARFALDSTHLDEA